MARRLIRRAILVTLRVILDLDREGYAPDHCDDYESDHRCVSLWGQLPGPGWLASVEMKLEVSMIEFHRLTCLVMKIDYPLFIG